MGTDRVNKNGEGYPDPTFGGAWGNIRREEKTERSGTPGNDKQSHPGNETDS